MLEMGAFEVLLAILFKVGQCHHRFGRLAGHVQAQFPGFFVVFFSHGKNGANARRTWATRATYCFRRPSASPAEVGLRRQCAGGRDDGGHALVLQPAKQPANFRAQHALVGKPRKQRFDGIQHHPLCPDGIDGVAQTDKQAFEVVLAVSSISERSTCVVEAQRGHVGHQFLAGFLERHEHARLVIVLNVAHQKLDAH